jgi:protocatechuate 3,4-dioxygenase alpha subunit
MSDRRTDLLPPTPGQTIGPFFHDALPYEHGHELVPPASPHALRLHGTVYDGDGRPVPDALVEIRQSDGAGHVPRVEGSLRRDGIFTGWGRAATDPAGRYSFTTVEPGGVHGGAPFYAVTVFARGLLNRLFTRAYLPGPGAEADRWLASLEESARQSLLVTRETDGSLRFDIHLQGDHETLFLTFPGHGR